MTQTASTKQRPTRRHHENDLVHNAVESYAEAIYARTDLSEPEKEAAIQKYATGMHAIWQSPERASNKK